MLKKIFKTTSFAVISILLISSILFTNSLRTDALSKQANGENPLKIIIEPSADNEKINTVTKDEMQRNERPDLGDDQVFPFVAGLDSYEAMR